jgi:hypothetical protein
MFAEIKGAAVQSTLSVKQLREEWLSEQTQQLFSRARESKERDGDLGRATEVARWGWSNA